MQNNESTPLSQSTNVSQQTNTSQSQTNISSYILDPLSVIIKLAILSKKAIGSKINIDSNVIYIQEAGIWQGLVRFVYKVKKDEIQYLYNPIQIASSKYLSENIIKQYPRLRNLFTNAINGLKNLTETYKQDILFTHALFMYESLINNYLEVINEEKANKFNPNLFKPDPITEEYSNSLMENFNQVWTDQRINIVLNMIEFIDKDSGYDKSIKCLEDLMNIIDQEIQNKVIVPATEPIISNIVKENASEIKSEQANISKLTIDTQSVDNSQTTNNPLSTTNVESITNILSTTPSALTASKSNDNITEQKISETITKIVKNEKSDKTDKSDKKHKKSDKSNQFSYSEFD